MVSFDSFLSHEQRICVVGLGYVGLPLAVRLGKHFTVDGFDIDGARVEELLQHKDKTGEVATEELAETTVTFSTDAHVIARAGFIVVAVPTPIDSNNAPDLRILTAACETIARHLQQGAVVVFESTVYPGVTEEVCVPVLEASGLVAGKDFFVGYSPERVNPGDKKHTIDTVTKIVSGMDEATLKLIAAVYSRITNVYEAPSIKVAEAAKVIENTQRDVNIAFMNELTMFFHKMDISVYDVIDAAATKWNFLPFSPGLVGGHCIGVDPYYLTYKSETVGHIPHLILSGRQLNDSMHAFLMDVILERLTAAGVTPEEARIGILGVTYKEHVPDIRNSKVINLYTLLSERVSSVTVVDPVADAQALQAHHDMSLSTLADMVNMDVVLLAVPHASFVSMTKDDFIAMLRTPASVVFDVKRALPLSLAQSLGEQYLTL